MYTYTTPTISCVLEGVEWTNCDYIRIAVKGKRGELLRIVDIADIDTENDTATIALSQEETAMLGVGQCSLQARIHYADGTVLATNKIIKQVEDVLDRVVI